MEQAINLINLMGWAYLLVQTEIELVFNTDYFLISDISLSVNILRVVQTLQVFDIVLLLMGKAKGNFFASFFQILGRLFVAYLVV